MKQQKLCLISNLKGIIQSCMIETGMHCSHDILCLPNKPMMLNYYKRDKTSWLPVKMFDIISEVAQDLFLTQPFTFQNSIRQLHVHPSSMWINELQVQLTSRQWQAICLLLEMCVGVLIASQGAHYGHFLEVRPLHSSAIACCGQCLQYFSAP